MKKRFRKLLESRKWIASIPNALTLGNSLCGFAAILITLQAYKHAGDNAALAVAFAWSAGMILFAMVFDAFDGYVARLLHAASLYGVQMDSLADMTTFGVAPATLVAVMAHNMRQLETMRQFIPICICCGIYLGCVALRLATYNVHAMVEKKSSENFSGLPSPGGAAAICSLVFICAAKHGEMKLIINYLPIYAAILGFLMVSPVPYVHFAKWILSIKRNPRRLIIAILFLIFWVVTGIRFNFLVAPVILINAYVVWSPLLFIAVKLGFVKPKPEILPDMAADEEDYREE